MVLSRGPNIMGKLKQARLNREKLKEEHKVLCEETKFSRSTLVDRKIYCITVSKNYANILAVLIEHNLQSE